MQDLECELVLAIDGGLATSRCPESPSQREEEDGEHTVDDFEIALTWFILTSLAEICLIRLEEEEAEEGAQNKTD